MSQKRKLEDPNEAFCQTPPKKSRTQYSLDFKLNVLDNAKSFSSNRTLASHFHIDEKQIRQWKKDESKLRSSKELVLVQGLLVVTFLMVNLETSFGSA